MLGAGAREKTILQVLFEAGFNSKASFNRAFKKHTGMTPSQFKKNRVRSPEAS
jgi:AraC-like DNA-binding protein